MLRGRSHRSVRRHGKEETRDGATCHRMQNEGDVNKHVEERVTCKGRGKSNLVNKGVRSRVFKKTGSCSSSVHHGIVISYLF